MNSELMMESINSGLMISIIGMSVVMFFLTLMMGVMRLNEKVMAKLAVWFPEEIPQEPKKSVSQTSANNELAIAIAAARKFLVKGGN